jgi:hypothetical protein
MVNLIIISLVISLIAFILLLIIEKTYTIGDFLMAFLFCLIPVFNVFIFGQLIVNIISENNFLINKAQKFTDTILKILNTKLK